MNVSAEFGLCTFYIKEFLWMQLFLIKCTNRNLTIAHHSHYINYKVMPKFLANIGINDKPMTINTFYICVRVSCAAFYGIIYVYKCKCVLYCNHCAAVVLMKLSIQNILEVYCCSDIQTLITGTNLQLFVENVKSKHLLRILKDFFFLHLYWLLLYQYYNINGNCICLSNELRIVHYWFKLAHSWLYNLF